MLWAAGVTLHNADRQFHAESSALSFTLAEDGHHAAVQFNERFDDSQSHTEPAASSRDRGIGLRKPIKHVRQELRRNANTVVSDVQFDLRFHATELNGHKPITRG